MTPFQELTYLLPNFDALQETLKTLLEEFNVTEDTTKLLSIFQQVNQMQIDFRTAYHLTYVLSMKDLSDKNYKEKLKYYENIYFKFGHLLSQFHQLVVEHPKRDELEKKLGKQFFFLVAQKAKRKSSEKGLHNLQKMKGLENAYRRKTTGQKMNYEGKEVSLLEVSKDRASTDRNLRKKAATALMDFRLENAGELEEIFEELVQLRHASALERGRSNFVESGYALSGRQGYGIEEVEHFNQLIQQYFVPLRKRMNTQKAKRLEVENLQYWDATIDFADGNPTIEGSVSEVMAKFQQLFSSISTELGELFEAMWKNGYIDAEARPNKYDIRQKITLPGYFASFVLTQIEGDVNDIIFLVHEMGHAFQADRGKAMYQKVFEYLYPSMDLVEIPSITMEFFALSHYSIFFKGKDLSKARYLFFEDVINRLVGGSANEAFQQKVYENPDSGIATRNEYWREIQEQYFPSSNDNQDKITHPYFQSGKSWLTNKHIFLFPFYMIDYSLARICALQLWMRAKQKGFDAAWKDYCLLCEKGGSISFLEALDLVNLKSPFEEETIREIAQFLEEEIVQVEVK